MDSAFTFLCHDAKLNNPSRDYDHSYAKLSSNHSIPVSSCNVIQWTASGAYLSAMTENSDKWPGNYLTIGVSLVDLEYEPPLDYSDSGFPALSILDEDFSRIQFDLNSEEEIQPCNHCDLIIGSGLDV